ncbi:2-dehydro-3-deoxy-D-arabinonate dehydratase [Streptosporangium becharense]|uniref:2-dehydro-3-deoxy-D-arabinonate dehydratase n=1 Tax=Streptosporangium becharense TaxID=1816182 RepID=A0A7W9IN54_9ACTN|nr:fumarylacetoacetate hydrolase family protein [Streptosporangium becharense]MBB2910346.1 2-dehydro-3-deoxy-D-arabinonate dehydratase [Streptosporangium becharense]MBB5823089.1 2-dehydro-3-deoxy-D-arabinonate dehydratase [Streptosporangium becharense]
MHIVRYTTGDGGPARVGLAERIPGEVRELGGVATLGELLRLRLPEIRERCESGPGPAAGDARLLPPVDGRMEVWAAGVTYRRSREARVAESERAASVYELVYDADRPELFFKSAAWRVTGDGGRVSVRADSPVNVPEPELALVLNRHGEIVGYTVCNDMSSRSIEGENPLYLPQAKIYLGGCAVGPAIRPAWEVPDPYALEITLAIRRGDGVVWDGRSSTSELHRKLDELAGYLFREDVFPDGAVLATGTSLVPELPFTLLPDDEITIAIGEVGSLTSTVVHGKAGMGPLADL